MDNDKDRVIRSVAEELGVGGDKLVEIASSNRYPGEDVAQLFQKLRHSMVAAIGDERENLAHWLETPNEALKGRPIDQLTSVQGFQHVIEYLDIASFKWR
jgi:antitoxin Xre/MbcA/ParS-like protein